MAARKDLYGDAINESLLMRPGQWLTRLSVYFDNRGIDGLVNSLAAAMGGTSGRLRRLQNGFVRSYALSMFLGAVLLVGPCRGEDLMSTFPWLTVAGAIPLAGALIVAAVPSGDGERSRDQLVKQLRPRLHADHAGASSRPWRCASGPAGPRSSSPRSRRGSRSSGCITRSAWTGSRWC